MYKVAVEEECHTRDGDFSRGEKTASTRGSGGPASLQPSNLNRPHGGEVGFGMAGPESASCRLLFFSGFMAIATAPRGLYAIDISPHLSSVCRRGSRVIILLTIIHQLGWVKIRGVAIRSTRVRLGSSRSISFRPGLPWIQIWLPFVYKRYSQRKTFACAGLVI